MAFLVHAANLLKCLCEAGIPSFYHPLASGLWARRPSFDKHSVFDSGVPKLHFRGDKTADNVPIFTGAAQYGKNSIIGR
jgi:hypothetical protein